MRWYYIYKEIIKNNIHLLTKDHIKNYAITQNEHLTDTEIIIIYDFIMNNYTELLNKNEKILLKLKCKLNDNLYNKIINLYEIYKKYL